MNLYQILKMFADGPFSIPMMRSVTLGATPIRTGGVLKGNVSGGVVTFDEPKPKASVGPCWVTLHKIEPQAPDAGVAYGNVPFMGEKKRVIRIEDA